MSLDPLPLSRIQFGFTVSFYIIFPAFTIGLAAWLATMEEMWLATGNPVYRRLFDFWIKIFAVSFGMGVVSGIVMAFQLGTNRSVLAAKTGSIQGPRQSNGADLDRAASVRGGADIPSKHSNGGHAARCMRWLPIRLEFILGTELR
jgi:hypothetical protein